MCIRDRYLPRSVIEVLLRYTEHYGIIMHTSYLPTGQRSRLKEVIQMQISSDINPRRRRDNQFFLEGKYDLRQGPQEKQGWEHRTVKRDRVGKHYPIMLRIS